MRKFLALGLLLLTVPLGGQILLERWTWFPVNGGAIAYDEQSRFVSLQTGLSGINTVTYYTQPKPGPIGAYSFLAERLEFECRGNRYRWSKSAVLDRSGRLLSQREDGEWIEMSAQLGAPALYRRLVCNGESPPPNVGKSGDVAELYKAMTLPLPAAPAAPPAVARSQDAPAPPPAVQAAARGPEPKAPEAKAATPAPKTEARPFDLNALAESLRNEAPAPAASPPAPKLRPD